MKHLFNFLFDQKRAQKSSLRSIEPKSQEHEVLLQLLVNYPEKVSVIDLVNSTKSVSIGSVVSHVRCRLKSLGDDYSNPIKNIEQKAVSKYGNVCTHSYYQLQPFAFNNAIKLEYEYRNCSNQN